MSVKFIVISVISIVVISIGVAGYFLLREPIMLSPKTYRIAIVTRSDVTTYEEAISSYRKRMEGLGYQKGKNIVYDIKHYTNNNEIKQIMHNVLKEDPDLIMTYSTPATVEAYQQTKNLSSPIPIVFGSVGDPLAAGIIKDMQKPGTNVTGVVSLATEFTANRIRFLQEINPSIKHIAMPHSADSLNDAAARKSVEVARQTAQDLHINLMLFPVSSPQDNIQVAKRITKEKTDGMIVGGDSLVWSGIDIYIAQAIKEKIPLAAFDLTQIAKGALIGIGPDYARVGEQAAALSHQILRGSTPATIPIQIPEKLILAINLATARAIGIQISDELLKQADVIIGK